jgi:rhodanese-related sulfurtransferase
MKTIAPTQLHRLLTNPSDLALLDVRTPVEYAAFVGVGITDFRGKGLLLTKLPWNARKLA